MRLSEILRAKILVKGLTVMRDPAAGSNIPEKNAPIRLVYRFRDLIGVRRSMGGIGVGYDERKLFDERRVGKGLHPVRTRRRKYHVHKETNIIGKPARS